MKTLFRCLLIVFLLSACSKKTEKESLQPSGTIEYEFVLIPGGSFIMGNETSGDDTYVDDYPHQVYIDSFYIDKYEVTNAHYFEFCEATGHSYPEFWDKGIYNSGLDHPDNPVTGVAWADAQAYAQWRGWRLPTEAEWEYAARGGLAGKNFPLGDDMDSTMANYYPTRGQTLPVGTFTPNGYGLHDMAGNVVEWVNDFYSKDYYLESPYKNPGGPVYGKRRVIRGGGWRSGKGCNAVHFRQSLRPYWVDFNVGFRCAKDIDD